MLDLFYFQRIWWSSKGQGVLFLLMIFFNYLKFLHRKQYILFTEQLKICLVVSFFTFEDQFMTPLCILIYFLWLIHLIVNIWWEKAFVAIVVWLIVNTVSGKTLNVLT